MMVVGLPVSSSSVAKFSKIHPLLPALRPKIDLTFTALVGVNPEYFIPASLGAYCMVRYVVVRFFVGFLVSGWQNILISANSKKLVSG